MKLKLKMSTKGNCLYMFSNFLKCCKTILYEDQPFLLTDKGAVIDKHYNFDFIY